MMLEELISLCDVGAKSKKECEKNRDKIYESLDGLTESEREVLADYLEELEMAIEWW